jgi:predicted DNA-binding transcriptional regulator YafY
MYEVGTATISRDIELMRDRLHAPIAYDSYKKGYYYEEETYRLPGSFATADNMAAIGMAENLLAIYKDTPIYSAVKNILDSITAPFGDNKKWYKNRIIVPPVPSAPTDVKVWKAITEGIRENKMIIFEYCGVGDKEFRARRVRPYQLLFDPGVWYLFGYAEDRKEVRLFSTLRIRNAELTPDKFILPADYDYGGYNKGNFGVFMSDKTYLFKVEFFEHIALFVSERLWSADQKIEERNSGILISFTSTQFAKVLQWVLSYGCNARPLEPKELVNEWKRHVKAMVKMGNA